MNIRDWPLGQIMQLPDCCFGGRFLVSCYIRQTILGAGWDISEIALPEKFVLWEVEFDVMTEVDKLVLTRLALGDQLPVAVGMVDALEPLLQGFGVQGPEPRVIESFGSVSFSFRRLRQPYTPAGRRLVMEVDLPIAVVAYVSASLIVSSIPTEVPDCLVSEYLRSQS